MPMKAACLLLFCFAAFASALICESNVDCRNARNCKATCTSAGLCNTTVPSACPVGTECNPITGNCVQCVTNDQCTSSSAPYCVSNVCSQCSSNSHCRSVLDCNATCVKGVCKAGTVRCGGLNPACDVQNGACLPDCTPTFDALCAALSPSTPHCSLSGSGKCVQCADNIHCQSEDDCGAVCANETCMPSQDINMNCRKQGLRCHPEGKCVECFSSQECGFGKKCSGEPEYTCIDSALDPCVDDFECGFDKNCNRVCNSNFTCQAAPNTTAPEDCLTSGLFCSGLGDCVECTADEHCGNPAKPYCQLYSDEPGFLTCVACTSDFDHCDATSCGSVCNLTTHACLGGIGPCIDPMTCGFLDGTPLCLDTCKSDADCTAASDRTRCDIPNEVCVQCLYDEECQDAMTDCNARCDEATGTCKTLGAPAICPPGRYCNPALLVNASTSTTCVQCQRDGHCTDPKLPFCSLDSFTCVGCTMDSDCKFDYNCDPKCANNKCVEGTTNLNCNSTGMFCDVNAAVCVECVDDHACISKNAAAPFCDAFGKCVACTTHADCRTNSSCDSWCRSDGICQKTAAPLDCTKTGSYCNNNTGKCLQCKKDSDCGSDAPICNTKTNTCIQCITEEHCANNTNCKGACMNGVCLKGSLDCTATKQVCAAVAGTYQCVTCRTDVDCTDPSLPFCYAPVLISDAQCVQCVLDDDCRTNSDCSATCNKASHTCVPSSASSVLNCNTSTSTAKVCDPTLGACTECLQSKDCPKEMPFCFSGVCHECSLGFLTNSDADCRTDAHCNAVCKWDNTLKKNLCKSATTAINCSSQGMRCDVSSGTCLECSADSDCSRTPNTPFCSPQGNCVECLGDLQCETNTSCSSTCLIDFTCSKGVDCVAIGATCNLGVCYTPEKVPSDCAWSQWTENSCKCGVATFTRSILKPASNGGIDCVLSDGKMTSSCNNTCPSGTSYQEQAASGSTLAISFAVLLGVVAMFIGGF